MSFVTNYDSRKGHELARERARRAGVPLGSRASAGARRRHRREGAGRRERRVLRVAQLAAPHRRLGQRAEPAAALARTAQRRGARRRGPLRRARSPRSTTSTQPQTAAIPRPPFWGGYYVWADAVELWIEGASRIHERARWTRSLTTAGADFAPARGSRRACSPEARHVAQTPHRDPAADARHRRLFQLVRPAQHHRLGRDPVDRRIPDRRRRQRSRARLHRARSTPDAGRRHRAIPESARRSATASASTRPGPRRPVPAGRGTAAGARPGLRACCRTCGGASSCACTRAARSHALGHAAAADPHLRAVSRSVVHAVRAAFGRHAEGAGRRGACLRRPRDDAHQQRGHRARDPAHARRHRQIRPGNAGAAVSRSATRSPDREPRLSAGAHRDHGRPSRGRRAAPSRCRSRSTMSRRRGDGARDPLDRSQ